MRKKKKGLTLVEVIVSLAILSIIITPVLSMVLSSVKTSKSGEDKQKALYLAQQYIEEEKSADSVNVSMPEVVGNFRIKKTVTALPEYTFPDVESNSGTSTENDNEGSNASEQSDGEDSPKTFQNLAHDCELTINTNKDQSKLDIVGKASDLPLDKTEENIIQVIGGMDKNGTQDINKITIKYNDYPSYEIDKQVVEQNTSANNIKKGYVLIKFTGDTELPEEDIPKIKIHASNYSSSELVIYFAREVGVEARYWLKNLGGKIKSYSNILINTDDEGEPVTYTNNSRVYKIIIRVWKKNQDESDKPIQEITAYKSVAQ